MGFREHVALQSLDGAVVVDARDEHLNPHGCVHGGLLATMLDVAMGNAVAEAGGERPVTVALSVTYLEPGQRGRLSATAGCASGASGSSSWRARCSRTAMCSPTPSQRSRYPPEGA